MTSERPYRDRLSKEAALAEIEAHAGTQFHPSLAKARWIIGVPYSLKALRQDGEPDGEDVVIYDNLQAGHGSRIGFSEGREAAMPFLPQTKPVDAFCACILDQVNVNKD